MATTTSPTTGNDFNRPINLLSLDAGGPRGVSQLLILKDVLERLSKDECGDAQRMIKRPCEVFDMIGGVGTGGLVAIFLVVFKMTANEALDEFSRFVVEVFGNIDRDPRKQTEKLSQAIHSIFERYKIAKDVKLIVPNQTEATCKLVVPVMYKSHVGSPCILRNYNSSHEPPVDLTIFEAMLATCSTPPIFTPTTISKDFATFEYVSGDIGLSNPTREVIAEAHHAFGDEATVSCLLSIGCGHPGVNAVPTNSRGAAWAGFLDGLARNCEKTAHDIATQMRQLDLYHRLSVKYGLEKSRAQEWKDPRVIAAHATTYLNDLDAIEALDRCVNTIRHGDGFPTLEQLEHAGGAKVLPPPLPPLAANYVERKQPMKFIEMAVFEDDGRIKPGSKRIVVTGIGGCGKTQLTRRFIEKHTDHFSSTFFIDGSSPDTIRRDIVRHVRALGGHHSQKSFDESIVFLSQAAKGQILLVIDNVDNSTLDLSSFLPRWQNGVVIVTSRNHSRGQLSASGHLQLDVMTVDESAELLVRGSGQQWPPTEADRMLAISVAKELGCHPIALVQAASYMYNTGCSPGTYIGLLRSSRDSLLRDHPATSQVDMRYKTAFAAFDASYKILPLKARNLWHLLSFFQSRNFPVELITMAALEGFSTDTYPFLPHGDQFEVGKGCLKEIFYTSDRWDPLELQSILATLRGHSLITIASGENATLLQMHPLVHEWGHLRMAKEERFRFEAAAIRLLCCGATESNYTMMQYLSAHVKSVSPACESLHANDAASLGFILQQSGMYEKYAKFNGIAHEMVMRELGPDHPNTITASINLAVAYHSLGRHAEAEKLHIEILRQRKQLSGVGHHDTIAASANLAVTYHTLGRHAEAADLKIDVLRQRTRLLGENHPDTIRASIELASTYHELGRYAEAEELETEVLRQRKQLLGEKHTATIKASVDLAITYHSLGRYAEAEALETEVLLKRKQLLGAKHPATIKASADLAVTYYSLGRYAEAKELELEVLRLRTTLLGRRHPDTINSMLYLAQTYKATQSRAEAISLAQKALQNALETLGSGHPLCQEISEFLASLPDDNSTRVERSSRYAPYKKPNASKIGPSSR